jgi:anthranilate phosphoribosyltransferase
MSADISLFIKQIQNKQDLSRSNMREIFEAIMTGQVEPEQMGLFLKTLAEKGETVDEVAGAADIMNEKVARVRCDVECIDTCGTGGDGISTFNVSTTAAIIAAGAGATVAKHGNRTNTRVSGSSEAVAALGINIDADIAVLEQCLRECGIAFLHAPNLHPAMKYAGPVRKKLGIRTIFNLLGPLTNPAGAKQQVMGVANPNLTEMLALVLKARGATRAWVVSGETGIPETPRLCDLTVTGPTRVSELKDGTVETFTVHPAELGLQTASLGSLLVDSPQASAEMIGAILEGRETGPPRDHALLNAAGALVVAGLAESLQQGISLAAESVDTGQANAKLQSLAKMSHN